MTAGRVASWRWRRRARRDRAAAQALRADDVFVNTLATPDLLQARPLSRRAQRWLRAYYDRPAAAQRKAVRDHRVARVKEILGLRSRS